MRRDEHGEANEIARRRAPALPPRRRRPARDRVRAAQPQPRRLAVPLLTWGDNRHLHHATRGRAPRATGPRPRSGSGGDDLAAPLALAAHVPEPARHRGLRGRGRAVGADRAHPNSRSHECLRHPGHALAIRPTAVTFPFWVTVTSLVRESSSRAVADDVRGALDDGEPVASEIGALARAAPRAVDRRGRASPSAGTPRRRPPTAASGTPAQTRRGAGPWPAAGTRQAATVAAIIMGLAVRDARPPLFDLSLAHAAAIDHQRRRLPTARAHPAPDLPANLPARLRSARLIRSAAE